MLAGYLILSFCLTMAYAAIMILYRYGWRRLPVWEIPPGFTPQTTVTVVIPARNEAHNIGPCLESVLAASYPPHLLEVLVVDDFSEDGTAELVQKWVSLSVRETPPPAPPLKGRGDVESASVVSKQPIKPGLASPLPFRGGAGGGVSRTEISAQALKLMAIHPKVGGMGAGVTLLRLADLPAPENASGFGKKRAIGAAIARARGELIVTTDADCTVPPDWLMLLVSAHETHRPRAIAGPVMIREAQNLLHHFQALDVAGTMGITGAGIRLGWQHIGNGANLAYPKSVFETVSGFAGNAHRASGDDLFLLQKIARRWPGSVFFLKNPAATVGTPAVGDWRAFFQQRLRWGAKNAALPETPVRLVLAAVFLFCCSIFINAVMAFFYAPFAWLLFAQMVVKAAFDYLLLLEMCGFFQRRKWPRWFWPSFVLHTGYVAFMGLASLIRKRFEWKGRTVE